MWLKPKINWPVRIKSEKYIVNLKADEGKNDIFKTGSMWLFSNDKINKYCL